jgi:DNA-binding NarL/FixJ family response regulator
MREAFRELFAKDAAIKLVAEARNGDEALALAEQHRPDIALLDISLGKSSDDGFAVAHALQATAPSVKIILMTGQDHSDNLLRVFVRRALEVNAAGFILKSSSSAEILESVRAVAAGHRHFSGRVTSYLIEIRESVAALAWLTADDCRTLLLLAEPMTSKEIAAQLCLATRTVENRLARIHDKLGLRGHNHLLKFAIEHKTELRLICPPAAR